MKPFCSNKLCALHNHEAPVGREHIILPGADCDGRTFYQKEVYRHQYLSVEVSPHKKKVRWLCDTCHNAVRTANGLED